MMVKNAENPVHEFVHDFMTNSCYCVVFYNIANFALSLIEWCFGIVWYCVKSYVLEPFSLERSRKTSARIPSYYSYIFCTFAQVKAIYQRRTNEKQASP